MAIDQDYHRRQKDAEGTFYREIVSNRRGQTYESGNTQGLYVCTASGEFLGYSNHRFPTYAIRLLKEGLKKYKPARVSPIRSTKNTGNWNPHLSPPKGGLVVRVNAKVLGGFEQTQDLERTIQRDSISRDNLWTTKKEHESLVKGVMLESLKNRIGKFHLVDGTRGTGSSWKDEDFKHYELNLKDGTITGSVHVENISKGWGHTAKLLGFVKTKDGKVTQFDLVAKGLYWGGGRYSKNPPKGKYPFATSFTLADGTQLADKIPPEGTKGWPPQYIQLK